MFSPNSPLEIGVVKLSSIGLVTRFLEYDCVKVDSERGNRTKAAIKLVQDSNLQRTAWEVLTLGLLGRQPEHGLIVCEAQEHQ